MVSLTVEEWLKIAGIICSLVPVALYIVSRINKKLDEVSEKTEKSTIRGHERIDKVLEGVSDLKSTLSYQSGALETIKKTIDSHDSRLSKVEHEIMQTKIKRV
jgi:predicted translin family RNA/ssDNA-binding protein